MTLCIKTGYQCCCQPDEGVFCPDYKPDWYVQCLMDAITELRNGVRPAEQAISIPASLFHKILEQHQLAADALRDVHGDVHRYIVVEMERRLPLNGSTSR